MKVKLLFLILLIVPGAFASDFVLAKNTKCKIFLKPSQVNLKVNWHGRCENGFADGLGVIRYMSGSKVDSTYYGQLKKAYWDLGVYESADGFLAGQFKNNEQISVKDANGIEDRNVTIHAFESASKAAIQLSQEFEKLGNKNSAKYYKIEAEKLSGQMD